MTQRLAKVHMTCPLVVTVDLDAGEVVEVDALEEGLEVDEKWGVTDPTFLHLLPLRDAAEARRIVADAAVEWPSWPSGIARRPATAPQTRLDD